MSLLPIIDRISIQRALKGGASKWINLYDSSFPVSIYDFTIGFLEIRDSFAQIDKCIFEFTIDASNFIQIRTGTAGSRNGLAYNSMFSGAQFSNIVSSPINPKDQVQNWGNRASYISISLDQTNNNLSIYRDGVLLHQVTDPAITGVDFLGASMAALAKHGGVIPINSSVNNIVVIDKVLTSHEHKILSDSFGHINHIFHQSILNHWPLTQKYYYNDGGILKAWDVVEQYNYSKVSPITPNHATLENFTLSEVGADEPANQSQILSTKSKQLSNNWGLKFNGVDQNAVQEPLNTNISLGVNNWSFIVDFIHTNVGSGNRVLFRAINGSIFVSIDLANQRISFLLNDGSGAWNFVSNESLTEGKRYILYAEKGDNQYSNLFLELNLFEITDSTAAEGDFTGNAFTLSGLAIGGAFGAAYAETQLNRLLFFNSKLTKTERRDYFLKNIVPTANLIEEISPEKRSDNQINTFAGNQLLLANFTPSGYDDYYRLKKSGLPQIKESLSFTDANDQRLTINASLIDIDTQEFTYIGGFFFNALTASDRYIFAANDGGVASTNNYIIIYRSSLGVMTFSAKRANDTENITIQFTDDNLIQGLNSFAFSAKEGKAELFINGFKIGQDLNAEVPDISSFTKIRINGYTSNGNEADANHYFTLLFSEKLSNKQIARISNNNLFEAININSLELAVLMNTSSFSENGSNVICKDYSKNNHEIIADNWTGATTADQLSDLLTNLTNINTLRL